MNYLNNVNKMSKLEFHLMENFSGSLTFLKNTLETPIKYLKLSSFKDLKKLKRLMLFYLKVMLTNSKKLLH